jgi:hypothetical protein
MMAELVYELRRVRALQPKANTIFAQMAAGGDITFDEAFTEETPTIPWTLA